MASTTPTTIAEAIDLNARQNIRSTSVDGQSVTGLSIDEQIAADSHGRRQVAATSGRLPIRFSPVISRGL